MLPFFSLHHEIGHYSGYRTHVVADYFYEITTLDDLSKLHEAYSFANNLTLPFLIIGGGTNLLFTTDRFPGVVVKNSLVGWEYNDRISEKLRISSLEKIISQSFPNQETPFEKIFFPWTSRFWETYESKQILHAYSNASIWDIASELETAYDQSLWHRFIWLPGSVWWAVFGNAGCFGLTTESNFVSATLYDMTTGEYKTLSKEEMWFSYRHSFLRENPHLFIVSACFDLSEKREQYASDVDNIYFREHEQPKWNSCGSFFKNPSREISAGALIESVWLKWYQHGGARWSFLHANFLMSDGESCLPTDLIELVRLTQDRVKKEKWFDLINEVRIL